MVMSSSNIRNMISSTITFRLLIVIITIFGTILALVLGVVLRALWVLVMKGFSLYI